MQRRNKLKAEVQIESPTSDGLVCPYCDGEYLHQLSVEIGWRFSVDGPLVRMRSSGLKLEQDRLEDHEVVFGYRRDYLVIRFSCEICSGSPLLEIRQHKGQTIFSWVEEEKAIRPDSDKIVQAG